MGLWRKCRTVGRSMSEPVALPQWWVIRGDSILDLLRRAASGENPDLLLLEAYANTEKDGEDE